MTQIVVDDFIIELNLKDNITKRLEEAETKVMAFCKRAEAQLAKLKIGVGAGGAGIPGTGLPGSTGGGSRPTRRKNFDDRAYAAANSAAINKLMNGNAAQVMQAMQAKSRIYAAAGRANGDQNTSAFRRTLIDTQNGLRTFNQRTAEAGAGLSRAGAGAEKLNKGATSAGSGLQKMLMGFFAITTAVHLMEEAIKQGVDRQRAENAMKIAYDKQGEVGAQMAEVKKLSDTYGTNLTEAYQQSAKLKNLLGGVLNDKQLAQYHEAITVEGANSTEEEKDRFTLALEKMGGAKNGGGVQFVQLQKSISSVLARMAKSMNMSQTQLREYAKTMSGQDFAKMIAEFMNNDINSTDATGKSQKQLYAESEQVQLKKVQNDVIDAGVNFNKGASEGIALFLASISDLIRTNQPLFTELGSMFGSFLKDMVPFINGFSNMLDWLDIIVLEIKIWYEGLSPRAQQIVDLLTDFGKDLGYVIATVKIIEVAQSLASAFNILKAAALAAAGGEGAGGLMGLAAAGGPIALFAIALTALVMAMHSHMSKDGKFFWDTAQAAKHDEALDKGLIQPDQTTPLAVTSAWTGIGYQQQRDDFSMKDQYAKMFADAKQQTTPQVTPYTLAAQKVDFGLDVKPIATQPVPLVLDITKLVQQIDLNMDYKVDYMQDKMTMGNMPLMDYPNYSKSPALQ
ncbi:hypothetical protein [Escherichia coli]|uniref:hypothetical protein n=1 Tax=Escherichia coli TaxID=562 RepID=UPI001CA76E2E|nr:hypothetical protein [Escherichia coli]QZY67667.1 hypothetical protein K7X33_16365 [Escherichia coli]